MIGLLGLLGPGLIAANAGNDAGGIATYSSAGAKYGYSVLWIMVLITVSLAIVQKLAARMGVVTGKGLADLIREEFGLRTTFFMMFALVLVNFTNVVAEFAGIASSLELFHISRYISVPLGAAAVWYLIVRGNYANVEKVFLVACGLYVTCSGESVLLWYTHDEVTRLFLGPGGTYVTGQIKSCLDPSVRYKIQPAGNGAY